MRTYTTSKTLQIPRQAVLTAMECQSDGEIWSVALSAGLTVAMKPETVSSELFYREEMMVIEDIQKYGVDRSTLFANRWSL